MAAEKLKGKLSLKIKQFREIVLLLITHIEASIDYPEHELQTYNLDRVTEECKDLESQINSMIASFEQGKLLKNGVETVIVGKPNVGKSSLLNLFLDEQRAIVTNIPGTTRDILQEYVNIQNIPFKITDTAGIRETTDEIEQIGVNNALERANQADLILFMIDGSQELSNEEIELYERLKNKPIIVIQNKIDLPQKQSHTVFEESQVIFLSTQTTEGFDKLNKAMVNLFFSNEINLKDELQITSLRHKTALTKAKEAMNRAIETIEQGFTEDIVAIDLMIAYEQLGEILGENVGESVIDKIFEGFCIGK